MPGCTTRFNLRFTKNEYCLHDTFNLDYMTLKFNSKVQQ